ncbi:hypothetical protein [Methanoregula sp.]
MVETAKKAKTPEKGLTEKERKNLIETKKQYHKGLQRLSQL